MNSDGLSLPVMLVAAGIAAGGALPFPGPPPAFSAAEQKIARITLTFGRGREVRIVPRGKELKAQAEIAVSGEGTLSGSWAVAGPMGPQDIDILFNEINTFSGVSSGETLFLESPGLPTAETGSYAVQLRVSLGTGKTKTKVIKYFVGERPPRDLLSGQTEVPELLASANPPEKRVSKSSLLSWDAVPGSLAYQLELFDKAGDEKGLSAGSRINACVMRLSSTLNRPPLVGLMVPAYRTKASLDELSGTLSLTEGNVYFWRVVAIDRDGKALCESPLREFVFSKEPRTD